MKDSRLANYLSHMQQAAKDAASFVEGMDKDGFLSDKRPQNAAIMSLLVIGEAATKILSDHPEFASHHASIPWGGMRGMRNRLAHGYFEINQDVVRDTLQTAVPALLEQLSKIDLQQ
jgi:uncharacterized protein with HEPN domain